MRLRQKHFAWSSQIVSDVCQWAVSSLPGPTGNHIRCVYYRRRLKHLGAGVRIDVGASFVNPEWISIEDRVWIDRYAVILGGPPREGARRLSRRSNSQFVGAEGEVYIGPGTHVGPFVVLSGHGGLVVEGDTSIAAGSLVYSFSHHHCDPRQPSDPTLFRFTSMVPDAEQSLISSPVVIRHGAAITLGCVVLPGVTIGRDAWVTPRSIVTRDVADGTIVSPPGDAVRLRVGYRTAND